LLHFAKCLFVLPSRAVSDGPANWTPPGVATTPRLRGSASGLPRRGPRTGKQDHLRPNAGALSSHQDCDLCARQPTHGEQILQPSDQTGAVRRRACLRRDVCVRSSSAKSCLPRATTRVGLKPLDPAASSCRCETLCYFWKTLRSVAFFVAMQATKTPGAGHRVRQVDDELTGHNFGYSANETRCARHCKTLRRRSGHGAADQPPSGVTR